MAEPGRSIGRSEEHQKQRAIGLVLGGGSAAFRPLHDRVALGRAQVPPTRPAAFSQADFKKRELIRHRYRLSLLRLSLLRSTGSSVHEKVFETSNNWE